MGNSDLPKRRNQKELQHFATDPAAFGRFYGEHVDAVKQFVARRVDDPYLVADLTGDIFVAAIGSARGYDARKGDPRAWLLGIARNVVSDEYHRESRERAVAKLLAARELVDSEDLVALHDRIDAESSSRALYRELRQLPDAERAVLELVALDGLKVREAAASLGITATAARVRLHRARRLMQTRLGHPPVEYKMEEVAR